LCDNDDNNDNNDNGLMIGIHLALRELQIAIDAATLKGMNDPSELDSYHVVRVVSDWRASGGKATRALKSTFHHRGMKRQQSLVDRFPIKNGRISSRIPRNDIFFYRGRGGGRTVASGSLGPLQMRRAMLPLLFSRCSIIHFRSSLELFMHAQALP